MLREKGPDLDTWACQFWTIRAVGHEMAHALQARKMGLVAFNQVYWQQGYNQNNPLEEEARRIGDGAAQALAPALPENFSAESPIVKKNPEGGRTHLAVSPHYTKNRTLTASNPGVARTRKLGIDRRRAARGLTNTR